MSSPVSSPPPSPPRSSVFFSEIPTTGQDKTIEDIHTAATLILPPVSDDEECSPLEMSNAFSFGSETPFTEPAALALGTRKRKAESPPVPRLLLDNYKNRGKSDEIIVCLSDTKEVIYDKNANNCVLLKEKPKENWQRRFVSAEDKTRNLDEDKGIIPFKDSLLILSYKELQKLISLINNPDQLDPLSQLKLSPTDYVDEHFVRFDSRLKIISKADLLRYEQSSKNPIDFTSEVIDLASISHEDFCTTLHQLQES